MCVVRRTELAKIIIKPVYLADAELCHLLTHSLAELKVPLRGIDLIRQAIRKIQLFDSQLTSIHADLCQLCLLAKCFKPALVLLNTDITSISQEVLNIMILTYDFFFLNYYCCSKP